MPFVANLVQVRMAHSTIKNIDLYVSGTDIAALNRRLGQRRGLAGSGISFDSEQHDLEQ